MKKAFLALGLAVIAGQALVAQEATKEIVYVEDPSQGYVFNRFKDNWFITAEGGANINFGKYTSHRDLKDRFSPQAALYVGKWFSPLFGLRVGGQWAEIKSLANYKSTGVMDGDYTPDGYYKQHINLFGANFDAMLNITNWWCGYKPDRVYNFVAYAGGQGNFTYGKNAAGKWEYAHDKLLALRAGLINSFRISKQMAIAIDLRYTLYEGTMEIAGSGHNRDWNNISANLSLTYNFRERNWHAPVVPVCPEPENCDPIRARLDAANRRIEELEAQLKACLARPVEKVVEKEKGPLVTVYFPINVSRLSAENTRVIKAVAHEMASHPDTKYTVTGWADTYTGNDQINARLRKNRAANVQKVLVANGVKASQLTIVDNINANLHADLGEKCASLDRAVTITED